MRYLIHIAVCEMRRDWLAALCFVASLIGGLTPLLLILALKNGVIDAMVDRLVEDPMNREIIAVGSGRHDAAFFEELAARREVGFVMPATRSINALADAMRNPLAHRLERSVPLMPTAPGDPLVGAGRIVGQGEVALSTPLAARLDIRAGQDLELLIGRDIGGDRQTARAPLRVVAILPPERYGRDLALVSLEDMVAVERFRDDAAVSVEDWQAPRRLPDTFASFRLFARGLEDLEPLAQHLRAQGIETRPRATNAVLLLGFRSTLSMLYAGIATLALAGFWAATAANLRGMVERQRPSFSLLALLGMRPLARRMIPLVQAVVLVNGAIILTLALCELIILGINGVFRRSSAEAVAHLGGPDIAATLLLGGLIAVSAAVWAMRAIDGIDAAEILTEG
ncbi:ABC transporter permease family protein [Pseudodonghicola xiamenensis]|uniref:ABC transporter n=1 Tax=Pseudodonghicola xiamenensis TaxID=337702 RepID=A0A8J3H801_9RHOB|nr:hypothetical protein [Pseudodonghicola xiamenensis]GHG98445.1 ABC transporter [Pseudodonghicola xiamenensis]